MSSEQHTTGFMSGFFMGTLLGGVLTYLAITPSGRRIVKQLLSAAEDVAEYGDEYFGFSDRQSEQKQNGSSSGSVRRVLKKLDKAT